VVAAAHFREWGWAGSVLSSRIPHYASRPHYPLLFDVTVGSIEAKCRLCLKMISISNNRHQAMHKHLDSVTHHTL